ncbi:carbon-nitrogen hydrolase family protein [Desulfobacula toluolica]|uniref:Predicted nitrilase/cyanide hydratase and apolipoprotein N-acyltransferase n=1 Tax=Desulfobacula toluolica (strain DSM 7467 / Tol2) TaxID=651182 RepID=K0NCS6_DESTT|nr:carbon-nitrogen hydrolase family protein [Desulfobacula toluolica]CCK82364.1 predicted nitrilase/cyanide hydratase and apolipoprotein N-acyltransferase [Desulfobacula toluolica Tol2]
MENHLNTALIHLDVRYKDPKTNCRELIRLNREAAGNGSQIIVNTEMGISGYSFQSREDIFPYTQTDRDEIIRQIKEIAREFRSYICLGFAEKDQESALFYNTAMVIDPVGEIILKYHKINAEARWACPGDPVQNNVFDTPWARIGVLICSDTYHSLMPRQTALKGADLILVPANWPSSGLDPEELWAIRAKENGIYIAACNRGGKDRMMSCENAPSGVFSPAGETLISLCSKESAIVNCRLPLTRGRLSGIIRPDIMADRNPSAWGPIYLDMRHVAYGGGDLTSYYDLATPSPFRVICHTAMGDDFSEQNLYNRVKELSNTPLNDFVLLVFPQVVTADPTDLVARLSDEIAHKKTAVCFSINNGQNSLFLITPLAGAVMHTIDGKGYGTGPEGISIVDTGPVRLGLCSPEELRHPETGVTHSKLGCDLLISSTGHITPDNRQVYACRSLDKICVAVAGSNTAFICQPPEGHNRWKESFAETPNLCEDRIDLEKIRDKTFQDRIDFKTLLNSNPTQAGKSNRLQDAGFL